MLAPVLSEGHSLSSLLETIQDSTSTLAKHDIFHSLSVEFDKSRAPLASDNDIDVVLHVKERGRVQLRSGTDLGNAEGNAYANLNLRNALGGAETVSANFTTGTRTRNAFEFMFATPIHPRLPESRFDVSLYSLRRDNTFYASHVQHLQGGHARLVTPSSYGLHELQYTLQNRQSTRLAPTASPSIIAAAGNSAISSLRHTFTFDSRNDSLLPSSGSFLRTYQELAGRALGGDVNHMKLFLEGQTNLRLASRSALCGSFKFGWLHSFYGATSHVPDRWQLGGPTDVRGFQINGMGPRDGRDFVGGDVLLGTSASLFLPVPGVGPDWPLRLQSFVNTGSLVSLRKDSSVKSIMEEVISKPSMAAGIGLIYRHPAARIELNFCLPIMARETDRTRKGLQFGIGIDFM